MSQPDRRRWPLRPISILVIAGTLLLTGVASWSVYLVVRDQNRRLLKERAAEVALVLNTSTASIPAGLSAQGQVLRATGGSVDAYESSAQAAVSTDLATSPNSHPSYAWVRPLPAGGYVVVACAGEAFVRGLVISDDRVAVFDQATATRRLVPTQLVGAARRVGFALGAPAAPDGTVLYRQLELGPLVAAPRDANSAPFAELDAVWYVGTEPKAGDEVLSTTSHLPLRGTVRSVPIAVGTETWVVVVKARKPLVGTVASSAWWIVLAAGIPIAALVGGATEAEARRRRTAQELYAAEHEVAETLQRSLLPEIAPARDLDVATRYLAAGLGQQVGGDWFDLFPVSGGRFGIVIGDVIGHDPTAAAAMAQVRATLRALAASGERPNVVIDRLDDLIDHLGLTTMVTLFYGLLDVAQPDGSRLLRYTNAGHLSPYLVVDGAVEPLVSTDSVILGAPLDVEHVQDECVLPAGAVLALFTDGLVEKPGESLDAGLERLAAALRDCGSTALPQEICDRVVSTAAHPLRDDIALLVVRNGAPADVAVPDDADDPANTEPARV